MIIGNAKLFLDGAFQEGSLTFENGVITAVGGEGALRCRLLDMGLTPRTLVTLRKVAPMGDPIEIHVRGYELTLRVEDARQITVEKRDRV